jgi:hypothetical protein
MVAQVCIEADEDPVAAFGRRITEVFRQGEERILRCLEATDSQVCANLTIITLKFLRVS